jgi:hypothetical protein
MTSPTSYRFINDRIGAVKSYLSRRPQETTFWIGAGMSAKYAQLPTWRAFLDNLTKKLGGAQQREYALISSLLEHGRYSLAAECLGECFGSEISDHLREQFAAPSECELPGFLPSSTVRDVITTNYDMLLEARLPWGRPVAPSEDLDSLLADDFKVIKLHGSVSSPDSCVLSLTSYIRAYTVNVRWYLANALTTSSVVFMGCSMNSAEPCFKVLRTLKASGRLKHKHYAVMAIESNGDGARIDDQLREYGIELIPYDIDPQHSFLDELFSDFQAALADESSIRVRLGIAQDNLLKEKVRKEHMTLALIHLWNATGVLSRGSSDLLRELGFVMTTFFQLLDKQVYKRDFYVRAHQLGACLKTLWKLWAGNCDTTRKAVYGLERGLERLRSISASQCSELEVLLHKAWQNAGGRPHV